MLIVAALLVGTACAAGGFGEVAGQLNFTLYPNQAESLQWGIINAFNYSLEVSLGLASLNGVSPGPKPMVTVTPTSLILNGSNVSRGISETILYANVTVNTTGVKSGTVWEGTLQANSTNPSNGATGVVRISLGTMKRFNIQVLEPPTTMTISSTTTIAQIMLSQPSPDYTIIGIVGVVIIVIVALTLYAIYATRKRNAKK